MEDVPQGQAPEPWGLTAIVDPAGLRFVHDLGPAGAGGAEVDGWDYSGSGNGTWMSEEGSKWLVNGL